MPFIKIQLEPILMSIPSDDRLCPQCRLGPICFVAQTFGKLLKGSGFDDLAITECDLFEGDEAIEGDTIIAQAEFEVRGLKPIFRRWIPEVPEGVCHKDILRGLMILVQEKEEPCSS